VALQDSNLRWNLSN